MRRSYRFCTVLIPAALLTVGACLPYRKGSFEGPATITSSGFVFPLYAFTFSPALSLHEDGERTYSFRGMPTLEESLIFVVEPFDIHAVDRLKALTTVLSVELRDDSGTLVCSGSGRLSEALSGRASKGPDDHWVLAYSAVDGHFWRAACTDIKLTHRRSYRLTVKISDPDPHATQISVRPVLYTPD